MPRASRMAAPRVKTRRDFGTERSISLISVIPMATSAAHCIARADRTIDRAARAHLDAAWSESPHRFLAKTDDSAESGGGAVFRRRALPETRASSEDDLPDELGHGRAQLLEGIFDGARQLVQVGDEIPIGREAPGKKSVVAEERDADAHRPHQWNVWMDREQA